jgi:transposase, IS30 family
MPGMRLRAEEREQILVGIKSGESAHSIGRRLGRAASTVSREIRAGGGREHYLGSRAHDGAQQRARRPKPRALSERPWLIPVVVEGLEAGWSPQQISRRLRLEHPDQPGWWVSHEAIYQALYLQGRGELRAQLTAALRTGRPRRYPGGTKPGRGSRGKIVDPVMITERPAEVDDRAVPGHWEGDLILGRGGKSQVGVIVERSTRFVMLIHLPEDRRAETVRDALAAKITGLPESLMRTLTWDQGKEMARHHSFTVATGIPIYFCDPHSPWQRGTAENTNGLLRQYLPRTHDLSRYSAEHLDAIADSLNTRPRQTLGWLKPSEAYAAAVATTT